VLELNASAIAFFVFTVIILGGALGVVTTRNLIHGALYPGPQPVWRRRFFVLLSAPFLAAVQVLVYIGAIAILIVFAVMLTRSMTSLGEVFNQQWWLSAMVGVFVVHFPGGGHCPAGVWPEWYPGRAASERDRRNHG
jgi:NADH:ubiquinone oxidoreductase subunit 6 (subunit J)